MPLCPILSKWILTRAQNNTQLVSGSNRVGSNCLFFLEQLVQIVMERVNGSIRDMSISGARIALYKPIVFKVKQQHPLRHFKLGLCSLYLKKVYIQRVVLSKIILGIEKSTNIYHTKTHDHHLYITFSNIKDGSCYNTFKYHRKIILLQNK